MRPPHLRRPLAFQNERGALHIVARIDVSTVLDHTEVQMRTGGDACAAHSGNGLALGHLVAGADIELSLIHI